MAFYRYSYEVVDNRGEKKQHKSLFNFSFDDIQKNKLFTYRYYTSESESQNEKGCYVVSIGYEKRAFRVPAYTLPYNRYSLHYFVNGKGTFKDMSISAGQMLIVPPYCHRHFESDPDNPLEFYYITVSGKGSEIIANDAGIKATESLTACPFIERIPQMFYSPLFEPHTDNDPAMFLLGFYYQLMSWHKSMSQKMDTDFQGKSYYYYKQALQYIEYYLLSDITPSSVADFLHISTPYLRKIFAKYNPCSLREYLVKKRIHYAADKLLLTNCTISDVAVEIGYDDHAHFSKLFKKYMGVSPGEYKKNHYTRDI